MASTLAVRIEACVRSGSRRRIVCLPPPSRFSAIAVIPPVLRCVTLRAKTWSAACFHQLFAENISTSQAIEARLAHLPANSPDLDAVAHHGITVLRHVATGGSLKLTSYLARYAAFVRPHITLATTSPKEAGVGTMTTPASFRISTFSCADSPKAEIIAPA